MKGQSKLRIMWRMLGLAAPLTGYMLFAIVCGVLGFACATAIPVLGAGSAWKVAQGELAAGTLVQVCWALVGLAVARGVLHYLEQRTNHYIAFRLLAHIRDLVFGALRRLAPAKLAGKDKGSLISAVTADVELLEVFYAHTISPVCIALIMSCLMVAFMGSVHPYLGLVAAASYLLVGVVVPLVTSRLTGELGREVRAGAAGLSGHVLGALRGLSELVQFGAGRRYLNELDERSYALVGSQRALADVAGASNALVSGLILLLSTGQIACAALLFQTGEVDGFGAVLAAVALMSSFGPVVALANLGTSLSATLAAGERVLGILDEEPAVDEAEDGVDISFSGAAAERVSFAYRSTSSEDEHVVERVLDDVSLEVAEGSVVAIQGKSGSGKSTLMRLFMRFWDVDRGKITVSGERVENITPASLRAAEALVEQDTYLFHDSIRDNLLVAKSDATQEELEAACRAASVHDFIESLPQGYDTMVGELGDTLSGGERQRLGLARAFLHESPFLLLDEPTSNLDALNEGAVLESIVERRGSRTVLLVSHRASTTAIADTVYAMEAGRVSKEVG